MEGEVACTLEHGGSGDSVTSAELRPDCRFRTCVLALAARGSLPGSSLRAVTAGENHACALTAGGAAFCWGGNEMGQLGTGTLSPTQANGAARPEWTPVPVRGELRFFQLSAGSRTTCGIAIPNREIYCWGYGQAGQTGDSAVSRYCTGSKGACSNALPSRVLPESLAEDSRRPRDVRFLRVDAGMSLSCGISVEGEAYCWGGNYRCALGRCRSADSWRARQIALPGRAVQIGAGYRHACARTAEMRVFCWGDNNSGQLGSLATVNAGADGLPPDYRDTTDQSAVSAAYRMDPCFQGGRCSPAPIEVSPGRRWRALSVGHEHACALAEDDGGVYCWGGSDRATLGNVASFVRCENRSATWKDLLCQATPVRIRGLPPFAAPAPDEAEAAATRPPGALSLKSRALPRVFVSRREFRAVFPADSSAVYSWSARTDFDYLARFFWGIVVQGPDGPTLLSLSVARENGQAREFPSLDSVVAAGRAQLCKTARTTFPPCVTSGVAATVDSGRLTLTVRDSSAIQQLFGLRQRFVRFSQDLASQSLEERHHGSDSVAVEYVDPQIPQPTEGLRQEFAESRRGYEASVRRIDRSIVPADGRSFFPSGALWLAVGDSTTLGINELECHFDMCTRGGVPSDSGWSVGDSSIVRLRRVPPVLPLRVAAQFSVPPSVNVVASKPGRTTIRVVGIHSSENKPSNAPRATTLSLNVVVTQAVSRLTVTPRPDTVRLGQAIDFMVRAVDAAGRPVDGPITEVEVLEDRSKLTFQTPSAQVTFGSLGRRTVIVRIGGRADTLSVQVVAAPRP
jgi:alpha-tubulin suppressor-like RCC1 family protein